MAVEKKIDAIGLILDSLYERLESCDLCPRECGVNRTSGKKGYCGAGLKLVVYTAFLHQGEEPAISGERGSGTIFFSGCNLKCIYCQNYKFSHFEQGKTISEEDLAEIMLKLQKKGAHNINLVTPTHFLPQILKALLIAFRRGLELPVVYNTSGYEKEDILDLIGNIVDVYLTDMKYAVSSLALRYSHAENYPFFNQKGVKKMYRQKNVLWEGPLIKEGLIIRHLVLPSHFEETIRVLSWIKQNIPEALLSLMFQYQPYYKAEAYSEISRRVDRLEYNQIKSFLEDLELEGWIQDLNSEERLAGVHFDSSILDDFLKEKDCE